MIAAGTSWIILAISKGLSPSPPRADSSCTSFAAATACRNQKILNGVPRTHSRRICMSIKLEAVIQASESSRHCKTVYASNFLTLAANLRVVGRDAGIYVSGN